MSNALRLLLIAVSLILLSQPATSREQNPHLQRGIAEFNQENYEEAAESLLRAVNAEPHSSYPEYYLGMTYKSLQDFAKARKHLKFAVHLFPPVKEAMLELAEVQYRLGEHQQALKVLVKAETEKVRPGQTAFLKGLILLKMDKNAEAIEAFEIAGRLSPELVQAADYQMGQALVKENRFEEAEARFHSVVNMNPDTDMAAFAGNFIHLMQKKKRDKRSVRGYLSMHYQYDDNVVLKPEDGLSVEDISDEEDSREVITGGIEYLPNPRRPLDLSAHYSFYISNHHELEAFDVMSHSVALVPSYIINSKQKAGVAFRYNHTWVDYNEYLSRATISPTYTQYIGSNHSVQTYFSFQNKEFLKSVDSKDNDRDSFEYSLNVNWFLFFEQDRGIFVPFMEDFELSSFGDNEGYFNLLGQVFGENADGLNWDNSGGKVTAVILVPLLQNAKFRLSGDIEYRDYRHVHTDFNKEREDFIYGLSALLFYKFHEYGNIQLLYSYRRDDSNISEFDYKRNVYSVGIEMRY